MAGAGGSCYHPAATSLIVQSAPANAGRALGLVGVGAGVGVFIGPLYAGWRAEHAGWRAPVFELGLVGCVAALLFLWLAEDRPVPPPATDAPSTGGLLPTTGMTALFVGACALLGFRDFAGSCVASLNSLFLQNAQGYNVAQVGLALSLVFLGSTISNPLFGHLSDRGRLRWITFILVCSGGLVAVFPHVPAAAVKPVLFVYGFFFLASFPTTEAALMVAVPAATRGRAFGIFLTFGFVVGNLAHWVAGDWVRRLGERANQSASYFGLYALLGLMILASLSALLCLKTLRRRERALAADGKAPSKPAG
jgi:MFS family permease